MTDFQLSLQVLIAGSFFITAVCIDLYKQKIPNSLCLSAIFLGFVINGYFAHLNGVLLSLAGFSLAFVILFPTFVLRVLGAGDIKLMMGIGALMGPQLLLWSLLYGVIAGAITSLLLIIWQAGFKGLGYTLKRYWDCFYLKTYFKPAENEAAGKRVPYAPALALGWLWACSLNADIAALFHSMSQLIS